MAGYQPCCIKISPGSICRRTVSFIFGASVVCFTAVGGEQTMLPEVTVLTCSQGPSETHTLAVSCDDSLVVTIGTVLVNYMLTVLVNWLGL